MYLIEVRKLVRAWAVRVVVVLALALSVVIGVSNSRYVESSVATATEWQSQLADLDTHPQKCTPPDEPNGACTAAELAATKMWMRTQIDASERTAEVGRAVLSPAGAAIATMGLFSSGIGVVLAILMMALSLDLEFRSDAWRTWLTVQGDRLRIASLKLLGVVTVLIGVSIASWIAMTTVSWIMRAAPQIEHEPPIKLSDLHLPSPLSLAMSALMVPIALAILSLAAGLITRSAVGSIGILIALFVVDRAIALMFPGGGRWLLVGGISGLTSGLQSSELGTRQFIVSLWQEVPGTSVLQGWVTVAVLGAVGAGLSALLVERRTIS